VTHFSWLDYSIFVVYLVGAVSVGLLFVKEQHTIKDYFLASRSMGFMLVGVSVLAALFSGISYLGCPSEVYAHRFTFILFGLSFIIATPVTTQLFVPHFFQSRFYTAYQYLEVRFSVQVRLLASSLFILRVLLWLALVTYAPALALEQVTGLPLWFSIICTGTLTTLYTTLGGMKAVIWTDVVQFVVLFGGQIVILYVAIARIPDGLSGAWEIGRAAGKLDLSLSLDPSVRVTLWGLLLGGTVINLVQLATDQVSVQRYLTATSLKEAQRALWLKFWLLIPVFIVFYLTGLVLYAFYQIHGDPLAAGRITRVDQILPYFVITQLPAGLPGLLIAAIFSGTMSATSSGLNALTTATLVDFRQRLSHKPSSEPQQLRLARYITIGYGALVILLAFGVSKLGALIEASNKAIGLVGGPVLGLFLLGMLVKRATPWGAVIGWAAGVAAVIPVCFYSKTSFLWYGVVGCVVTVFVGWLASLLISLLRPAPVSASTLQAPQGKIAGGGQRPNAPPEPR
jgi:sodium-coupled monocarboxylate transporter 8/12